MLLLAGIALIVTATHWPALQARALSFDDNEYLVENYLVRHPSWTSTQRFLTEVLAPSTVHGYYQPLTMISLMLDSAAGGTPEQPLPFHRTSLMLHVLNTALIVIILHELFGNIWAAAMVGLLFGVHPLMVEPIPWIGERKTLLAAFFSLGSVLSYIRFARSRRWTAYGACLILYVLGLLSKPTGTMLPFCLLLLDVWPLRRLSKRALLEKVPLLIVAAVSAWITVESQRRTAMAFAPTVWADPLRVPYIICHNIVFYLWKFFWPARLSSHYPFPWPLNPSQPVVLAGLLGTASLLAVLIVSLRWTRALAVGWLFFFAAIFPTLGVIGFTNVIASDKYIYLPVLGFLLPLACGLAWLLNTSGPKPRRIGIGVGLVWTGLVIAAIFTTRLYLSKWTDTATFLQHMLHFAPQAPTLHLHWGLELARQKRHAEAEREYRIGIAAAPNCEVGYFNLGAQRLEAGQYEEAIPYFQQALERNPRLAVAHNCLGNAYFELGRVDEAVREYEAALAANPRFADARYNLANVWSNRGDLARAAALYEEVLREVPDHAPAHSNLGAVKMRQGDMRGAVAAYRLALKYRPEWWDVARLLALVAATSEDPELRAPAEGVRLAQEAVRLAPAARRPAVIAVLAVAYGEAGNRELAEANARQAISMATAQGNRELVNDIVSRMRKYLPELATTPAEK